MLLDELNKVTKDRTLITVERDSVGGNEITGHILILNDDFIFMEKFTDEGIYDGFTIFSTDQVSEVFWGNRIHQSISKLINNNLNRTIPDIKLTSFEEIISQVNEQYGAIGFMDSGDEDEDDFDVAEVISIKDGWVKLLCFGTMKTLSRLHKVTDLDNYSRIEFNRPYIDSIVSLHKDNL